MNNKINYLAWCTITCPLRITQWIFLMRRFQQVSNQKTCGVTSTRVPVYINASEKLKDLVANIKCVHAKFNAIPVFNFLDVSSVIEIKIQIMKCHIQKHIQYAVDFVEKYNRLAYFVNIAMLHLEYQKHHALFVDALIFKMLMLLRFIIVISVKNVMWGLKI